MNASSGHQATSSRLKPLLQVLLSVARLVAVRPAPTDWATHLPLSTAEHDGRCAGIARGLFERSEFRSARTARVARRGSAAIADDSDAECLFYSALHASPFGSPASGAQCRKRIVFAYFLFGHAKRKSVAQQGETSATSNRENKCFIGPSGSDHVTSSRLTACPATAGSALGKPLLQPLCSEIKAEPRKIHRLWMKKAA